MRPPQLFTSLTNTTDSVITISVSEAEELIAKPLKIYDLKKKEYTISSYQFLYTRKAVTEDEETKKVTGTTSIVSERFQATPLPEMWIKTIREQVRSGEELFFVDIIVMDEQDRVMYAPSLKITIR